MVDAARRRLGIRKIGHAGTLDPLATGVLVLGVGAGTRLLEYLVGCEKEYQAELTFGATSDSFDADGEVQKTVNAQPFEREKLEQILPEFTGEISQVPPKFSAIKIAGKAAYARARAGEDIQMKPRAVRIFSLELTRFLYPKAELKIHCGSGTFIRSLAHDLGQRLGVGAYLSRLTRSRVGAFQLTQAIAPSSIRPEKVLPLEMGVTFSRLNLTRIEADKIRLGQKIGCRAGEGCGKLVAGFCENIFLAVLEHEPAKRALKPIKVFHRPTALERVGFATRRLSA